MDNNNNKLLMKCFSREVNFRAWSTKHNMMYRQDISMGIDFKFTPFDLSLSGYEYPRTGWYDRDLIKMQFTGLYDKNGERIYDGDIVKWYNEINEDYGVYGTFLVVWQDESASFLMQRIDGVESFLLRDGKRRCKEKALVIGNIFENPKLLEATTDHTSS